MKKKKKLIGYVLLQMQVRDGGGDVLVDHSEAQLVVAAQLHREGQHLSHRQVSDVLRIGRHEAAALPQGGFRARLDAVEGDGAGDLGIDTGVPRDDVHQRGLAALRGAEDHVELAPVELPRHPAQYGLVAHRTGRISHTVSHLFVLHFKKYTFYVKAQCTHQIRPKQKIT
jgi:hypothetical protein